MTINMMTTSIYYILLSTIIFQFTGGVHNVEHQDHNAIITCEFNLETCHSLFICFTQQKDFLGCNEGRPPWDLVVDLPTDMERYSIGKYEIDHIANTLKSTLLIRNVNHLDKLQNIFCHLMQMSLDEDNKLHVSHRESERIEFPPSPGKRMLTMTAIYSEVDKDRQTLIVKCHHTRKSSLNILTAFQGIIQTMPKENA